MNSCKDCNFFWIRYDDEDYAFFNCTANPPIFDDKIGWMRPGVYPEDKPCRFFKPTQETEVKP